VFEKLVESINHFSVVLEPEKNEVDWWAGAPSVLIDNNGKFYLAARMRHNISPRGRRGYELWLLKSDDGKKFNLIKKIHRDEANILGFERPSLLIDPITKKFKLYGCTEFPNGWGIWKLNDVDDPQDFDPSTLHQVELILPENEFGFVKDDKPGDHNHHSTFHLQFKDPFIIKIQEKWHMFVIGFDRVERPYHFTSIDGEKWSPMGSNPIMESSGWHNFFTRPACIVPMAIGYLFVYEGSNLKWRDPVYNIATGLAYSPDLVKFIDLTPDKPLLVSTTQGDYKTWRYSHWLIKNEKMYVYYESCRPNNSNEIRLSCFDFKSIQI
jgi:hypothetical protein